MFDAMQVGFLFPFPRFGAGENQQRATRKAAADFFDHPKGLNIRQVGVDNAGIEQAVVQEGIGLLNADPVDDAILLRVQSGTNRFAQLRVLSQYQDCLHRCAALMDLFCSKVDRNTVADHFRVVLKPAPFATEIALTPRPAG